jgi:hypothetical protein
MKKRALFLGLCVLLVVMPFFTQAISAETVTITGTINSSFQLVTEEGDVYEIGENRIGDELSVLAGKVVTVIGIVEVGEEWKVIIVQSYEIIGEKT